MLTGYQSPFIAIGPTVGTTGPDGLTDILTVTVLYLDGWLNRLVGQFDRIPRPVISPAFQTP